MGQMVMDLCHTDLVVVRLLLKAVLWFLALRTDIYIILLGLKISYDFL